MQISDNVSFCLGAEQNTVNKAIFPHAAVRTKSARVIRGATSGTGMSGMGGVSAVSWSQRLLAKRKGRKRRPTAVGGERGLKSPSLPAGGPQVKRHFHGLDGTGKKSES